MSSINPHFQAQSKWLMAGLLLLAFCGSSLAQKNEMNVMAVAPGRAKETAKETERPSAVEEKLARTVLNSAGTEVGALEPLPRSYVCYQAARGLIQYDRDAARKLLMECFTATQSIEDKRDREQLQGWIVQELLNFGPQTAEELLPQVEGQAREMVREKLIEYYTKEKKFDEAIALVNDVRPEEEHFPYKATTDLIDALPDERSGDSVSLFSQALNNFKKRPPENNIFTTPDMGTFVLRFASRVPDSMALEAIDELLRRAKAADEDHQHTLNVSISTDDKAANLSSNYEYRLFQILPALRRLDPDRAEDLLQENQKMKMLMTQYPQGLASMDPRFSGKPAEQGNGPKMSFRVSMGNGAPSNPGNGQQRQILLNRQVNEILKHAEDNPKQSIAQALSLPGGTEQWRANALEGIARTVVKTDPQMARNAIDELVKACEELDELAQERLLTSAVNLLLEMNEKEEARKLIEHGFDLAAKLFERDSSASDPNKAAKVFWPASSMWRSFLQLATKISPQFALLEIKEIQNPEIQLYEKVSLANAWLGVRSGMTMVREQRKNKGSFMINSSDDR